MYYDAMALSILQFDLSKLFSVDERLETLHAVPLILEQKL